MLTERIIRDAKPKASNYIIRDKKLTGLGLRVTPAGDKSFVLNYRTDGRRRQAVIGKAAGVSLVDARNAAGELLTAIKLYGADPVEDKRRRIEAPTVAEGVDRFLTETGPERIEIGRMAARTLIEYRNQCRRYILPKLGSRKVADVTRRDVELAIRGAPNATRNRVLALVSRLWSEFDRYGWEFDRNPAKGIQRAREEARDRTLSTTELQALAATLNASGLHPAIVAAIRFAMFTGLRIGEVLAIRWDHVSLEAGRVTLPETKTGRRTHDLPTPAQAILSELPTINGSDWVFTTGRDAPITYRTVAQAFRRICETAGLADARLHDLRRTVMTRAAASGASSHVLRDLLGHKTAAMADRYVRAVGTPVRDAREAVAAGIAAEIEGGDAGKVLPLRKAR